MGSNMLRRRAASSMKRDSGSTRAGRRTPELRLAGAVRLWGESSCKPEQWNGGNEALALEELR